MRAGPSMRPCVHACGHHQQPGVPATAHHVCRTPIHVHADGGGRPLRVDAALPGWAVQLSCTSPLLRVRVHSSTFSLPARVLDARDVANASLLYTNYRFFVVPASHVRTAAGMQLKCRSVGWSAGVYVG
jgi:hypothetical protein